MFPTVENVRTSLEGYVGKFMGIDLSYTRIECLNFVFNLIKTIKMSIIASLMQATILSIRTSPENWYNEGPSLETSKFS